MKDFILTLALVIIGTNFLVFNQDNNMYQQQMLRLKYVCENASDAGAQYIDEEQYKNGKFVFNQVEASKAIKDVIITDLKLDNNFIPLSNTYLKDKVTYSISFYDDSNSDFTNNITYKDPEGLLTHKIKSPTVVVSINAGRARYRIISNSPYIIRTSAHSWVNK